MFLFDEIKKNDDVADDHADKADDSKKGHEAERRAHDVQCDKGSDRSERHRCEDYKRLDGVFELKRQCQKDRHH